MRKIAALLFFAIFTGSFTYADTVYLINGNALSAQQIIEVDGEISCINADGSGTAFPAEWVEKIVRGDSALDEQVRAANAIKTANSTPSTPPADREIKSVPGYDLLLQDWSLTRPSSGQDLYVTGRVKNISQKPLPQVYAATRFFDGNKGFITDEKQLIEQNPIQPGHPPGDGGIYHRCRRTDPDDREAAGPIMPARRQQGAGLHSRQKSVKQKRGYTPWMRI